MRKDRAVLQSQALKAYADYGGQSAAEMTGVPVAAIRAWARHSGVKSGYRVEDTRIPCPSLAAYERGCRCDECGSLHREAAKEMKAKRVKKGRRTPERIPHGVSGYANWDCRCGECRQAWTVYLRGRRQTKGAASGEAG